MRFVPVKSAEQQGIPCMYRIRSERVAKRAKRTAQINQIRGLLAEFGLVMSKDAIPPNSTFRTFCKSPRKASRVW